MMEGFPEQLTLNEKLVEDMVTKINAAGKNKCVEVPDKRFVTQKLRRHLARIKKYYLEKRFFLQRTEIILEWEGFWVFRGEEEIGQELNQSIEKTGSRMMLVSIIDNLEDVMITFSDEAGKTLELEMSSSIFQIRGFTAWWKYIQYIQ